MEQLRHLTPLDLKPEFTEASFREAIAPLLRGETPLLSFETVHRRADRSTYPVEARVQLATRDGHKVCLAIILDISARKRAEEAARLEEERLRVALDAAAITVFECDTSLRYTWVYRPRLGLSPDALVGHTDEELFGEDGRAAMVIKRRVLRTGRAERQEVRLRTPERELTFALSVEPRHSEGGELLGLRGASLDISELKQWQAQFFQAQKMESIGRLAGGVAHDFNNLLTVIMGNVQLALDAIATESTVHRDLQVASQAAESAAILTQQLLTFSRRQVIEPRDLDLSEAIARVERLLPRLLGERVTLTTATAPDLGAVRFDPGQFEQVLVNLAVNARDAMPDGGTLTVEATNVDCDGATSAGRPPLPTGHYVMLSVSDTGTGMSDEIKAHVFEPFFSTKGPGMGTGLGLAMVHGAVSQNGGYIEVQSEPGRGTTFRVYLPRQAKTGPAQPAARAAPGGSETVVLVEDDEGVRDLASRLLRHLGYSVRVFGNGLDALEAVRTTAEPVHLLMTDVIMPVIDGRTLAKQIALIRPAIRVLYMSGYTADVIGHDDVLHDGAAFLAKPFTLDLLARRVREVLDRPLP
jgi:signal transduction histidine kinase